MSYNPDAILDALPASPGPHPLVDFSDRRRLAAVVAAFVLVAVQYVDLLTTRAVLATGNGIEANPLAGLMGGLGHMAVVKLVIANLMAVLVIRLRRPSLALVMALSAGVGCYLAVVASNLMVLHLAGGL